MKGKFFGLLMFLLLLSIVNLSFAGVTGKIAGRVTDKQTGEPIIAANIEVINPATGKVITGAATDIDGYYFVLNLRPGVYDVKASAVGYRAVIVKNVVVHADKTTTVNFELQSEAIKAEPVVITAKREKIQKDVTSSGTYTDAEQIESMPVTTVNEVLEIQAGVVERGGVLHFRGGRAREVSYRVDGMPVQDPTYGYQALTVSTYAVQEVQTQTGAFNAEYGNALSAVVSIVTKEGDPNKFAGSIGYSTTNFRIKPLNKYSTFADRLDFSISGPEPITTYLMPLIGIKLPRDKRISYFLSVSGENSDTRLPYNRKFDLDYPEGGQPIATLEELNVPYKIKYGWYGFFPERRVNQYQATLKLKQKLSPSLKVVASYTGNWSKWRNFDWTFYYTPKSSYISKRFAHQFNVSVTHNISPRTFYIARAGYLTTKRTLTPGGLTPGDFMVDSTVYGTLDEWVDINGDGKPQVRLQWWDANGNGMWDYGEGWIPGIERIDTIWKDPATRDEILRLDTIYSDTIPPRIGEEPWVDFNNNGIFEPRMTNFNSPWFGYYSLNLGEPFMDGEPFLDGYPYGLSYEDLINGLSPIKFHMETLWIDINKNGIKDFGEYVFGSQYWTEDTVLLEELTWVDKNENGRPDWGEYVDINKDGLFTQRDRWCNYIDANGNGQYDVGELGEPFLDLNGNGKYDPPNGKWDEWDPKEYPNAKFPGEPYLDRNGNGKYDPFSGFQYRGFDRWAVWHKRTASIFLLKGDLTSQVDRHNQIKTGIEFQRIKIGMNEIQYPENKYDGIPDTTHPWPDHGVFRSFYERTPMTFAAYVQDKMEYGGLIANVGIRLDAFIQAKEVLEDTTQEELRRVLEPWWEDTMIAKSRITISPRLGMSYPVTERSKLFFSYGHFYQLPGFDNFYQTPTQASNAGRLLGNPNLTYEKTVAYELGVAYAITDEITVQFSGYYKDIYDLLNTSHAKLGPLTQDVYINSDYARSRGIEISVDKSLSNYWSLTANYTFSYAYGKSSSDRSGYDAQFNQTAIPLRDLPLDWDQRHRLKGTLRFMARKGEHPNLFGLKLPDRWMLSFIFDWGSGFPYTPSVNNPEYKPKIKPGEKAWERTNALRMPPQFNLDMKFSKDFDIGKHRASFYVMVDNLTNRHNVRYVYSDTGKPDKSWVEWIDDTTYVFHGDDYSKNPAHWEPPISIRLGVQFNW